MKKNQFALIFLTLVVMLAVWYIKSPLNKVDKGNNNPTDAPVISTRVAALTSLRDSVREERSLEVASLDTLIQQYYKKKKHLTKNNQFLI